MKKESLSITMLKLIMTVSLIVGIGAVLGILGYFGAIEKGEVVINHEVEKEIIQDETGKEKGEVVINHEVEKEIIQDETGNWKTYNTQFPSLNLFKDLKNPFAFKYPSNWSLAETKGGIEIYSFPATKGYGIGTLPEDQFKVEIWRLDYPNNPNNLGILEWCDEKLSNYNSSFRKKVFLRKERIINNLNIAEIEFELEKSKSINGKFICFAGENNDNIIVLGHPLNSVHMETFNQILSTFKFIEKEETNNEKVITEEMLASKDNFDYKLETFEDYIDQRIIKIDKNDKKEILIPSVRESLPELRKTGRLLHKFAIPQNSDLIFLKSAPVDAGGHCRFLYSYDISLNKFRKLKINEKMLEIHNGLCSYDGFALSVDQKKFIWIPESTDNGDNKIMYLIDLLKDDYKLLVELKNNETFNGGMGAISASHFIEWIDDNKIKYAVYDQSKKSSEDYNLGYYFQESIDRVLIEYREIVVK